MRVLLLLVVVFGSLPVILTQPFVGLLVYTWLAYMRPHDMVWGAIPQVSLFVALALIAGMVLAMKREKWITAGPQTSILIAFGGWFGLASLMAVDPSLSTEWTVRIAKILLISLLTTGLVRTQARFRTLYLVVTFSLGFLGLKYGFFGLVRGGTRLAYGPGGFMIDNNSFAMALNMALPLLVGAALVERNKIIRVGAIAMGLGSAAAIIFTFSRGGLITLTIVLVYILARSGRPILVTLVLSIAVAGFLVIVSPDFEKSYGDRAGTIATYEAAPSAVHRIREWGIALLISKDYPVFGVGPNNLLLVRPFYPVDPNDRYGDSRVTHNSFLQMLVAIGYPGFLLFTSALVVSFLRLEKLRRASSKQWVRTYASMMQGSFLAYSAGGMFLEMAYFDLIYHLVGMSLSLEVAAAGSEALEQSTGTQTPGNLQPWWRPSAPHERPI